MTPSPSSRAAKLATHIRLRPTEVWQAEAACRGEPMSKWVPMATPRRGGGVAMGRFRKEDEARARLQCSGCPVRVECGIDALLSDAENVIQGGYRISDKESNRVVYRETRAAMRKEFDMEGVVACRVCRRPVLGNPHSSVGNNAPRCVECSRVQLKQYGLAKIFEQTSAATIRNDPLRKALT